MVASFLVITPVNIPKSDRGQYYSSFIAAIINVTAPVLFVSGVFVVLSVMLTSALDKRAVWLV